jgi:ABC-type oligopeptide transport system substrate-binding subunit
MKKRFLIPLFALALALSACSDTKARVAFENTSKCGTIKVRLNDTTSLDFLEGQVPMGEKKIFEVKPDTFYEYLVDFTAGGVQDDGRRCQAFERGQVKVPSGSTQTFKLESQVTD